MDTATRLGRVEEHLADLAAAQARTEHTLAALAEAQLRTEHRVEQLAAAQERTEEQMKLLAAAQERTEEQTRALALWRHGESNRRAGERYELGIEAQGKRLFQGGTGGTPLRDRTAQSKIADLLPDYVPSVRVGESISSDPINADLLWWKGDRYVVVEVSIVVDESDVSRAHARASTLRDAGIDALPAVIGDNWVDDDTHAAAERLHLAWFVGREMNDRFVEFRRLPAS